MRILAFSDSHGHINSGFDIIDSYLENGGVDAVIHAGDVVKDEDALKEKYPHIPIYAVCGNNDFYSDYPFDITVTIGGKKIFITHGHNYNVRMGNFMLKNKMNAENIDLIVYGHTHIPEVDVSGKGQILNPGSLFFGRTYGVIDIFDDKIYASVKDV